MDAVLKHKFWILAGLVLPLALVGYFMSNGSIAEATKARISEIEAINVMAGEVNETHTAVAKQLADELEKENQQQLRMLDEIQRKWMTWPPLIEEGLEVDAQGRIVYRGTNLRRRSILDQYYQAYDTQMEELYYFVNPVVVGSHPYPTKKKVFIDRETIPMHHFTPGQTATIKQIWDAQEDYWIVRMIFTAVNETNSAAEDVNTAIIRQISRLELFGGTGESSVTSSGSSSGGSMASLMGDGDSDDPGGDAARSMMGNSQGGKGATLTFNSGSPEFDPSEEYGPRASGSSSSEQETPEKEEGEGFSISPGLFGGGQSSNSELRYVGFDEEGNTPFRRRAFYMSVLIDESKIPDFIGNLANLDPPIHVVRFAFANNPYDDDPLLAMGSVQPTGTSPRGGTGASPFGGPTAGSPFGDEGEEAEMPMPFGSGGSGSFSGSAPQAGGNRRLRSATTGQKGLSPGERAELEQYESALTGRHLVQLELAGDVTIFTPEIPEEEADGAMDSPITPPAEAAPDGDAETPPTQPTTPPSRPDESAVPPKTTEPETEPSDSQPKEEDASEPKASTEAKESSPPETETDQDKKSE